MFPKKTDKVEYGFWVGPLVDHCLRGVEGVFFSEKKIDKTPFARFSLSA